MKKSILAIMLALPFLSACTLQPMYGDFGQASPIKSGAELSQIEIAPIGGRIGVELRNELIFTLTGGGAQAANAKYRLEIALSQSSSQAQVEQVSGRPLSSLLYMSATYLLFDVATNEKLYEARSFARSSFDKNVQRFNNIRAERDAEDRAVKTLAQSIRNSLASYFAQKK